jgi:Mg2+ and Co2+ transporter CorA
MPGGEGAQFWDIVLMMGAMTSLMIWYFKRRNWL